MKRIKKWLFPILTCLIVIGAAVLPPYVSQVKDGQQFEQIHSSELNADALPVREERNQLERLELYAHWYTNSEIVPSFQTPAMNEELAEQVLDRLTQAGVLSATLLWEPVKAMNTTRILLWNPADNMGFQQPAEFWRISASLDKGSLLMDVDGESGLPLFLSLYDPNIAQWLKYDDPNTLLDLAEWYFELVGLKARLVETDAEPNAAPWERQFAVEGTELYYCVTFNATTLNIGLG